MARGGYGRGAGIPLNERVRPGAEPPPAPPGPGRHVWVTDPVDHTGVRRPGLLVEWRREPTGWQARVVYVAQLRADSWATVSEWLPADRVEPA